MWPFKKKEPELSVADRARQIVSLDRENNGEIQAIKESYGNVRDRFRNDDTVICEQSQKPIR